MLPGFCIAVTAILTATAAFPAQLSDNAVQVALRAATFINPPLSGAVTVAIVYETGDAASEREARDIERAVSGMTVGKLAFSAKRVPTGALDQLAGARMAFVTQGANSRQVAAATAARSILSVSFDRACIRAGFCVLAVSETPRVQIIVSKAATSAAKLRFDSSFLMLVKEN